MRSLLKIESSGCDTFSDVCHYQFHSTLAQLVVTISDLERLNIPSELYRKYKECISSEMDLYRKVYITTMTDELFDDQAEALCAIRLQTDDCYRRIRELIYATYLLTSLPDEREGLETLIYKLNQVTIQTKILHYQNQVQKKEKG